MEIPKLNTPFSKSFLIKDIKNSYYLYSGTFTETLKQLNNLISRIQNDQSYNGFTTSFDFYLDKKQLCFTYIVSEIKINLHTTCEEIFESIRIYFRPLITIFSFFLSDIFTITKVYFFEKRSWGYRFIHMLESPDFHKTVSETSKIKQFISQDDVELIFPCILTRMCGKEHYLEFIDGYIAGKIKSFYLGNKISNYWNCLEYFANKFCKDVDKNRIIHKKSKRQLNKIINGAIGLMTDDDVEFPNLTIRVVKSKGWLSGDNRPPILNRIFYMFERKKIYLSEEEKKIIRIIYEIRNKLYHEENYLTRLLGKITRKFKINTPTLKDIGLFTKQFSLIVEKMILRFFRMTPNYFVLKERDYYHFLENRVIDLPSLRLKAEKRKEYHNERFNIEGLTEKEALSKHLIYDKKELTRRGKYIPIVKYLDRLKFKIQQKIQENDLLGIFTNPNGSLDGTVKFNDNLNGTIEVSSENRIELETLERSGLEFISDINPQFGIYRIKFIPLIQEISYIFGNESSNGKFFTLMLEIKEFNDP